jgi:hypothetical protein
VWRNLIIQLNYWKFLLLLLPFFAACTEEKKSEVKEPETEVVQVTTPKAFTQLSDQQTGIAFRNDVVQNDDMNLFVNQYTLNGGGVAVGDLNNDGLPDLYFTANQSPNKLYLNKGGLSFEDITEQSGAAGNAYWTTGVTIVDVNADGWNDIYVCHAGNYLEEPQKLANELYINNGDATQNNGVPTFTEQAASFGLAGEARSIQATFFDYDNDNDLDVYIVNHPYNFFLPIEIRLHAEKEPLPADLDRLYRNDGNNTFTDVTKEAGVERWAFGLSASAGDLNSDGWTDLFIANDYSEKDVYLINQKDGTFKNAEDDAFFHISNFSMGSDIADINNDLLPDLFVVDMMAEDNRRKKTNMSAMQPEVFWDNVAIGRHHQYMQNVLQLNNGNGTYSDIAELAGLAYSDWSWSAIFSDLDNDGWKDLFISNGLPVDFRNSDLNKKIAGADLRELRKDYKNLIAQMPSEPISNYAFQNNRDLTFTDQSSQWGLDFKGFTNGTAIADLDRDGDLDIVVNNLNDKALVFQNNNLNKGHYVQLKFDGPEGNPAGIGVKVMVKAGDELQMQQLSLARGYQSGGEAMLHFGIGNETRLFQVEVFWPDGKRNSFMHYKADRLDTIAYSEGYVPPPDAPFFDSMHVAMGTVAFEKMNHGVKWFENFSTTSGIDFKHSEIPFDDYKTELLLPHKYSQLGPTMSVGDVNGDGFTDVLIGGAHTYSAQLYLQGENQQFQRAQSQPWEIHKAHEDMGILFFDADRDQDLDVYISSGGNEWTVQGTLEDSGSYGLGDSRGYKDRLYINDGKGNFTYDKNALSDFRISTSCVKSADFDGDGDLDLFIGGRIIPGSYPAPAGSMLLRNNGGFFEDVTERWAPELKEIGLVTDAQFFDYNNDGLIDLCLSGEWMPITLFKNTGKQFTNATESAKLADKSGWWYSLHAADVDGDGDVDLIAGNLGLNAKYKGTDKEPFQVFYDDFDANGTNDIVLGYYNNGSAYPVRGRQCTSEQMPVVAQQFPTYQAFGTATLVDVYGQSLDKALNYKANWMATSYLENKGDGTFETHALPNAAQLSTVNGIVSTDINHDGNLDLVLAGNMHNAEVETKRHDASIGTVLLGNGKGGFHPVSYNQSGFAAMGDVKDLVLIKDEGLQPMILAAGNDKALQVYRITLK